MTTTSQQYEAIFRYSNPAYLCVCQSCRSEFTIHVREPRVSSGTPSVCPLCNAPLTLITEEFVLMDVFDYIALDFKLAREAVEGIYDLWAPEAGDAIRFVDFLKQAIDGKVS